MKKRLLFCILFFVFVLGILLLSFVSAQDAQRIPVGVKIPLKITVVAEDKDEVSVEGSLVKLEISPIGTLSPPKGVGDKEGKMRTILYSDEPGLTKIAVFVKNKRTGKFVKTGEHMFEFYVPEVPEYDVGKLQQIEPLEKAAVAKPEKVAVYDYTNSPMLNMYASSNEIGYWMAKGYIKSLEKPFVTKEGKVNFAVVLSNPFPTAVDAARTYVNAFLQSR